MSYEDYYKEVWDNVYAICGWMDDYHIKNCYTQHFPVDLAVKSISDDIIDQAGNSPDH